MQTRITILAVLFLLIIMGIPVSAITAHINVQPIQGQAPLAVFFSDASEGNPVDWRWDFGDGDTGEGEQIMHTYFQSGTYSIRLRVTDESGATDTREVPDAITVEQNPFFPQIPTIPRITPTFIADFKVSKKTGTAPLPVQFTDLSTGDPTSWVWDFGDGATDITQNPVHVYTKPGVFSIKLTTTKETSVSSKVHNDYISVLSGGVAVRNQSNAIPSGAVVPVSPSSMNPTAVQTGQPSGSSGGESGSTITSPASPISQLHATPEPGSSDKKNQVMSIPFIDFYNRTRSLVQEIESFGPEDMLRVGVDPATVSDDGNFSVKIQGMPGEDVYFWIIVPEKILTSVNPLIPIISPGQKEITFDDPVGPYWIGTFIPDEEGENLSIRTLIPMDPVYQGTHYYGLARLPQTGSVDVVWNTTGATQGEYFIRAESAGSGTESGKTVRKAAASIEVLGS